MKVNEVYDSRQRYSEVLSVEGIPKDKRPTAKDWKYIQGGKPKVVAREPGLVAVVHNYANQRDPKGSGAVVPTSVSMVEKWPNKTVLNEMPDGRIVAFPAALVWKFHGKGCEGNSGEKYERVTVTSGAKK